MSQQLQGLRLWKETQFYLRSNSYGNKSKVPKAPCSDGWASQRMAPDMTGAMWRWYKFGDLNPDQEARRGRNVDFRTTDWCYRLRKNGLGLKEVFALQRHFSYGWEVILGLSGSRSGFLWGWMLKASPSLCIVTRVGAIWEGQEGFLVVTDVNGSPVTVSQLPKASFWGSRAAWPCLDTGDSGRHCPFIKRWMLFVRMYACMSLYHVSVKKTGQGSWIP